MLSAETDCDEISDILLLFHNRNDHGIFKYLLRRFVILLRRNYLD